MVLGGRRGMWEKGEEEEKRSGRGGWIGLDRIDGMRRLGREDSFAGG